MDNTHQEAQTQLTTTTTMEINQKISQTILSQPLYQMDSTMQTLTSHSKNTLNMIEQPSPISPIIFLLWNSKGIHSNGFKAYFHELLNYHKPSFIVLIETKAKGDEADIIMAQFNFQHTAKVDADELSGRIYILWNDKANVQPVALTPQEIYLFFKVPIPPFSFFLNAIYSKPYPTYKHAQWENLENFAKNCLDP